MCTSPPGHALALSPDLTAAADTRAVPGGDVTHLVVNADHLPAGTRPFRPVWMVVTTAIVNREPLGRPTRTRTPRRCASARCCSPTTPPPALAHNPGNRPVDTAVALGLSEHTPAADSPRRAPRIGREARFARAADPFAAGLPGAGVAARLGFTDTSAFSHAFKRWTGGPGRARGTGRPKSRAPGTRLPRVTVSTDDIVRHAAKDLVRGTRLDLSRMSAELGISRATFFRRVGNREDLMGAALLLMSDRTWAGAIAAWHAAHGDALRDPGGRLRCLWIMEAYRREVAASAGLHKLIDTEPVVALRVLTDPRGRVQPTLIEAHTALIGADVEAAGLRPLVSLPDLSYAVVRLGESFLYADVLAARAVDLAVATTLLDALVLGALGTHAE